LVIVFDSIEYYAPGFKASIIGRDVLTPPDLEKIFGLTGGVSVPISTVNAQTVLVKAHENLFQFNIFYNFCIKI